MNIEELKNTIIEANKKYRNGDESGFTDIEFDYLCEELESKIPSYEYSEFRNSLNEGMVEYGKKIKHPFIAGSLDKLKYEEPATVKSFLKKYIENKLNVSAKVDGLTGILHYKNGILVGCTTRGDGYEGISIFEKAKYINGIPKTIPQKDEIYIRGEIVILKENYDKLEGSSPRNIVSGIINRKETKPEELKYIDFIAYTIMGDMYCKVLQLEELRYMGFDVVWNMNIDIEECFSDDIVDGLFEIASMNFKYEVDGLVLSDSEYVNEEKYRPTKQVAFKTNQQTFETRLIDVEWQGPSKDGKMSCLGILEPCDCNGVIVSKCTLHNLDFLKKTNVKIGDFVQITRSGDVIPKFIKVTKTTENSVDIELPTECPCCASELVIEGPFLYCKNEECLDKKTYQVMHFIKKCEVENASFKTLKNFGINSIRNLLDFKADSKYKSEVKLENEIVNKILILPQEELFTKLNMKDIGETLLKKIVDFYGWEKIHSREIEKDTLTYLPEGIGDITMNKFLSEYNKNLEYVEMIVNDQRYNKKETSKVKTIEILGSICFTGSLNTMSRTEASKLAESKGYQIKSSVSKGLTYLVTNDKFSGSSKNKKAQQYGTKIIDENEFLELIKDNIINVEDL